MSAYNNTKWKGGQLKLQYAKESSLSKLIKEREEAKCAEKQTKQEVVHKGPTFKLPNKPVPGSPVDAEGTWVVGKYNRVLPVLRMRKPGTKKLVTLDPSKMMHSLKKINSDDFDASQCNNLTWDIEEDKRDITRWRQGIFFDSEIPKKKATKQHLIHSRLLGEDESDSEIEIIPIGQYERKFQLHASKRYNSGDDSDSAGSADTDEIISRAAAKRLSDQRAADCSSDKKINSEGDSDSAGSADTDEILSEAEAKRLSDKRVVDCSSDNQPKSDSHPKILNKTEPTHAEKTALQNNEKKKVPKSKTRAARTPMFRGIGMLTESVESRPESDRQKLSQLAGCSVQSVDESVPVTPAATQCIAPVQKELENKNRSKSNYEHVTDRFSDFEARTSPSGKRMRSQDQGKQTHVNSAASPLSPVKHDFASVKQKNKGTGTVDHNTHMQKSHDAYKVLKETLQQKENLVTKALREGAESNQKNHIVFSDAEDEEVKVETAEKEKKLALFDSESDSEIQETDFSLRPQFHGRKGQKLLELQSRLKDSRFKFDEDFKSDESEEEEDEKEQEDSDSDEMKKERMKNMEILEKVLGYTPAKRKKIDFVDMNQKRFNPDKQPLKAVTDTKRKDKKRKRSSSNDDDSEEDTEQVSPVLHSSDTHNDDDSKEDADQVSTVPRSPDTHDDNIRKEETKATWTSPDSKRLRKSDDSEEPDVASPTQGKTNRKAAITSTIRVDKLSSLFTGGSSFSLLGSLGNISEDAGESVTQEPFTFSKMTKEESMEGEEEEKEEKEEEMEDDDSEEEEKEDEEEEEKEDEGEMKSDGVEAVHGAFSRRLLEEQTKPVEKQSSLLISKDDPRLLASVRFFKQPDAEAFEELRDSWPEERRRKMELFKERQRRARRHMKRENTGHQLRKPKQRNQKHRRK